MTTKTLFSLLPLSLFMSVLIVGCSGSGTSLAPGGSPGTTQTFGPLTTRLVGAAQAPVTSSAANGANVTALAGALVDQLTLNLQGPGTLSDTKIAFVSERSGFNSEIYSMNMDGTSQTRLTSSVGSETYPSWSRDGAKIAFVSSRDSSFEIYSMNADGTGQTRLTNNAAADFSPSWSPDGSKIAFQSDRDSSTNEIYVMNADGTSQTRLTSNTTNDFSPSWSPDGSKIVFTSARDDHYQIYVMNSDGTNQTRLNSSGESDHSPSWSPDGFRIAFKRARIGVSADIYTMEMDGSGEIRLTTNATTTGNAPSWSPDSSKIAFESNRDGNYEIYSMSSKGYGPTNLTRLPSIADYSASWSGYLPRTPRTLIGSAGTLGTAAAGFLFGQKGRRVTTVVAFDTPTAASRTGARVINQSAPFNDLGSNLIFSITTSAGLSSIRYADINEAGVPGGAINPVLPAGTTGALVSFDAYDGTVTSIVAYAANRSVSTPTRSGNHATYTGGFSAIFDGAGKNL
uniref:TolB family protein n=1 Tax=Armatimonas sp. TaxID=1872638 RepID=UPI00374DB697